MKVTFGFVNCNRLYYLKSCLESLLYCTEDYEDKEIIIVDNASIEKGTEEYLQEKEKQGFHIKRQKKRDPSNEFAKALNCIAENALGDFICPLQGDVQFVVKGRWLQDLVDYYMDNIEDIGSVVLDAQRRQRIYISHLKQDEIVFRDSTRYPVLGAADVFYSRQIVEKVYPWKVSNESHEGGKDSETAMLEKVQKMMRDGKMSRNITSVLLKIPVSAAILTDARGTNARVRGNKRYGDYWPPKKDFRYYKIWEYEQIKKRFEYLQRPIAFEELILPIRWQLPLDNFGELKKNPIRPETATEKDYENIS